MFISKFSIEDWQGTQNKGSVQVAKNWQQIQEAIEQLDGRRRTLVTLETDGEAHMAIGRGSTQYFIYVTFDNEEFYYVANPASLEAEESLIVGGQEGIYPSKFCVGQDIAMKVAKTFAELGVMDKSMTWQQDKIAELQKVA